MKRLIVLFLACSLPAWAASFTDFYAQTTGSNLNAGSTPFDAADYTYASGTWVASTGVFTVASGNPTTDINGNTGATGVAVGAFASVYADGSSLTAFVGRVTARTSSTITVSLTAVSGSPPADGTSNRTVKIGGAWKGPNNAEQFPYSFIAGTLTDASGNYPYVNLKNGSAYPVTAAMTHSGTGPVWFGGYTTTPRDGGRAVFQGTTGAAYILLTVSATNTTWKDLEWDTNGSTGGNSSSPGMTITGARNLFQRCVWRNMRASGVNAGNVCEFIECEAYNNNKSNTATFGGFSVANSGARVVRCVSHHNGTTGTNSPGFRMDQSVFALECIAHDNFGDGYYSQADQSLTIDNCDAYNNARDGLRLDTASTTLVMKITNCLFAKNGGWAVSYNGSSVKFGYIYNLILGSGTWANTSGGINSAIAPVEISGTVNLPSNTSPWVDAANGNFAQAATVTALRGAGRGVFYQSTTTPLNVTVGYPGVGAAPAQATGGQRSYSF